MSTAIHDNVKPLAFLLGTWKGEGEGVYPTIKSFNYGEEAVFATNGKPAISYTHKTWKADGSGPMHGESGFLRPKPDGTLEAVYAQVTGIAEAEKGTFDAAAKKVTLRSSEICNATKVKEIMREYEVSPDGNTLTITVSMATTTHPLQKHLHAVLKKVQ